MDIIHLSEKEFEQEVLQSNGLVLVDFWAPWCRPCQMIAPILDELAGESNHNLKICKVNVDEHQRLATRYQVLSVPTILFFKQGKIINQLAGVRTASEIKEAVAALC